jgi:hypothetical protein
MLNDQIADASRQAARHRQHPWACGQHRSTILSQAGSAAAVEHGRDRLADTQPGSRLADFRQVLVQRIRSAYREEIDATKRALLVAWSAFGVTFGVTRAITLWLRSGRGPAIGGIVIRGRHIHHYNIGIALLTFVGAVTLCGRERHRRHPLIVSAYGSGVALVIDELALLIDLRDVYWGKDGQWSVDAAIGTLVVGGVYLAATPFWHQATRCVTTTYTQTTSG